MQTLRRRFLNFWSILSLAILLVPGGATGYAKLAPNQADAYSLDGAEVVGNQHGASYEMLLAPQGGKVNRAIFFGKDGSLITPAGGTTTPLVSQPVCGLGGYTLFSGEIVITGTMTGSSPTLTYLLRESKDGGTTWHNVGTWTQITTTSITTPANTDQQQTVSDVYNNTTAVAYGDCWDVVLTFGGTGSVGGHVKAVLFAK